MSRLHTRFASASRASAAMLIAGWASFAPCASADPAKPLIPPFPPATEIQAGERTPPPVILPDRIEFPATFQAASERAYWDIPLPERLPRHATSLRLDLACPDPAPLRSVSLHLKSGKGWYAFPTPLPLSPTRQSITLPRGMFVPEGDPDPWHKARLIRLSAWKNTPGSCTLALFSLTARSDTIAVVSATELTAPGESAFAASLVARCAKLLTKAGIAFAVIDDTLQDLDACTLLLLPYSPTLPTRQCERLERFVKNGGKLILFYNASAALGPLLGIRPGSWQGCDAGQEWSSMVSKLPGIPCRIPHLTGSILPPFPSADRQARTVAVWADATGRTTDLPACVLSDRGAWFAHIPPLAYPSAVAFIRAVCRELAPDETPDVPPSPQPVALARPNKELRCVWETSGYARHPQGWEGLLKQLSAHGINTVFAHWQSAGTAHYRTHGKRVESDRVLIRRTDPLTDALDAGRKYGVSMHAWVTCWTLEGSAPAQRAALEKENRLMRNAEGQPLPWLCPSIPENRALIINGLRDLTRRGVSGIHFDYLRYPDETGCYAPATRRAFESKAGTPVANWPADVLPGGSQSDAFRKFRRDTLTAFVREARDAVRAINPTVRISAAVFPTPETAAQRGQDWPAWIREGLVDFVCPMTYSESDAVFSAMLDTCAAAIPSPATQCVAGIGTGADESQLDAAATARQAQIARSRRLAGFAFFSADTELCDSILPALFP